MFFKSEKYKYNIKTAANAAAFFNHYSDQAPHSLSLCAEALQVLVLHPDKTLVAVNNIEAAFVAVLKTNRAFVWGALCSDFTAAQCILLVMRLETAVFLMMLKNF